MAKITNIYVTHGEKEAELNNQVIIRVSCDDGRIKYIESNYHGFKDLICKDIDSFRIIHKIENGYFVVDFLKIPQNSFPVYKIKHWQRDKEAIFIDVQPSKCTMPFKQPVYFQKNDWLKIDAPYGALGLDIDKTDAFCKSDKIVSKKSLIYGIAKSLKICYPELKIKLNSNKQNVQNTNE